jgi:hypothetical protein
VIVAKSGKRQKQQVDKSERKSAQMNAGGTSKYAKKKIQNSRGNYKKTSPFYLSPKDAAAARLVGAAYVDSEGKPCLSDGTLVAALSERQRSQLQPPTQPKE